MTLTPNAFHLSFRAQPFPSEISFHKRHKHQARGPLRLSLESGWNLNIIGLSSVITCKGCPQKPFTAIVRHVARLDKDFNYVT
jgi:hypothetical protein